MNSEMLRELVSCATHPSGTLIFGGSQRRRAVLTELAREHYLETVDPKKAHHQGTPYVTIDDGAHLRLSEMGRHAILKLNPADFASVQFYPLPSDVEKAQERLKQQAAKR